MIGTYDGCNNYTKHFGIGSVVGSILTNPNSSDVSTADTVRQMTAIVQRESCNPHIQELAKSIVKDAKDVTSALAMIWYWVKRHVRFLEDESVVRNDQELLITPIRLITMPVPQGDCDDYSMLTAALIMASGVPTQVSFVTIAADEETPDRWSHVYVSTPELVMDTSHGEFPGWEYQGEVFRKKVWGVSYFGEREIEKGETSMIANAQVGPLANDGGMGMGAVDWGSIIEQGFNTAYNVINRRVGGSINPGEYRTGAGGTQYRLPVSGGSVTTFPGTSFGGSSLWLLGAVGLGIVLIATRR